MNPVKDPEYYYRQGNFIEKDVLSIVEQIYERWPGLIKVQYNENLEPNLWEAPYRIIELCSDGAWRPVFECWALDQTVIDRLMAADMHKSGKDLLTLAREAEAKKRAEAAKELEDQKTEDADKIKGALKSNKSKYSWARKDGSLAVISK